MYGDYLVLDSVSEQNAKRIFQKLDKKLLVKKKALICIGGISGTRKSETAYKLAELLIKYGKQSHIISGDDYYNVPWHIRNETRATEGIGIVGPEEWDWTRLGWTLETFRNPRYGQVQFYQTSKFTVGIMQSSVDKTDCDVLILEGLYACHDRIKADAKIHIGSTDSSSTYKFRSKRGKENEQSELRKAIVEVECKAVENLKQFATIVI